MRLVIVESPFRGDPADGGTSLVRNKHYLERCLRDCISRGESPYASHKLLTDCLDDDDPVERKLGIEAGLSWRNAAAHVFYVDLGWSDGMKLAKELYDKDGIPYEERNLPLTDVFWKEKPPGLFYSIGSATRLFLHELVQERIDELEVAEEDCLRTIGRVTAGYEVDSDEHGRLEIVRAKLDWLRTAVKELR